MRNRDNRQGFRHGIRLGGEPGAQIGGSNNLRLLAEIGIAADMIAMNVGIDDVLQGLVAQFAQRGINFFGKRQKFVIHDQEPVRSGRNANVASGTEQHMNVPADGGFLDFHLAVILMLLLPQGGECEARH